ncbi:hypothetical protein GGX14DRAFT_405271 [Mycena pura]|uniref:Uncharacterized protein n=1 Tax=Mycena pura TaxID=153505 RepID=A0AAD6USI9_9AGAR|nr:hypothetical protein GGX14DRAFT_405271 [Mycena pura]
MEIISRKPARINIFTPQYNRARFPLLWYLTVQHLDLASLQKVAQLGKWFHRLVYDELSRQWERSFSAINLSWPSFRFMLVHSSALFSGLGTRRLLFPSEACSADIEIFVSRANYSKVVTYLEFATDWVKFNTELHPTNFLLKSIRFKHKGLPERIIVHVCSDDSPRTTLFKQPLAAQFVYFDGRSLVVPYSQLTFSNDSIANCPYLPQSNAAEVKHLKLVAKKATQCGYDIRRFHPPNVLPLQYYTSLRSTLDTDCQTLLLRDRVWGAVTGSKQPKEAVVWCLGAPAGLSTMSSIASFILTVPVYDPNVESDTSWAIRFDTSLDVELA